MPLCLVRVCYPLLHPHPPSPSLLSLQFSIPTPPGDLPPLYLLYDLGLLQSLPIFAQLLGIFIVSHVVIGH